MCAVCIYVCVHSACSHTLTPTGHPRAGISEKEGRDLPKVTCLVWDGAQPPKPVLFTPALHSCSRGQCTGGGVAGQPRASQHAPCLWVQTARCVEAGRSLGEGSRGCAQPPPVLTEDHRVLWVATLSQGPLCSTQGICPTLRKGTGSAHCPLGRP